MGRQQRIGHLQFLVRVVQRRVRGVQQSGYQAWDARRSTFKVFERRLRSPLSHPQIEVIARLKNAYCVRQIRRFFALVIVDM